MYIQEFHSYFGKSARLYSQCMYLNQSTCMQTYSIAIQISQCHTRASRVTELILSLLFSAGQIGMTSINNSKVQTSLNMPTNSKSCFMFSTVYQYITVHYISSTRHGCVVGTVSVCTNDKQPSFWQSRVLTIFGPLLHVYQQCLQQTNVCVSHACL